MWKRGCSGESHLLILPWKCFGQGYSSLGWLDSHRVSPFFGPIGPFSMVLWFTLRLRQWPCTICGGRSSFRSPTRPHSGNCWCELVLKVILKKRGATTSALKFWRVRALSGWWQMQGCADVTETWGADTPGQCRVAWSFEIETATNSGGEGSVAGNGHIFHRRQIGSNGSIHHRWSEFWAKTGNALLNGLLLQDPTGFPCCDRFQRIGVETSRWMCTYWHVSGIVGTLQWNRLNWRTSIKPLTGISGRFMELWPRVCWLHVWAISFARRVFWVTASWRLSCFLLKFLELPVLMFVLPLSSMGSKWNIVEHCLLSGQMSPHGRRLLQTQVMCSSHKDRRE